MGFVALLFVSPHITHNRRIDGLPVVEVPEYEVAVVAALLAKRDEVRLLKLKLGTQVERTDVVHLEIIRTAARLTRRL
jgi:hypothetical protein